MENSKEGTMRKKKKHISLRLGPETKRALDDLEKTFRYDTKTKAIEFAIDFTANKMLSKRKKLKFKL